MNLPQQEVPLAAISDLQAHTRGTANDTALVNGALSQAINPAGRVGLNSHSCIGAPHQLFLGLAVVHGKGIQINGGVAASERAEVNGPAVDATAQQLLDHLRDQLKPRGCMGVKALAHRRARRNRCQTKGAHEEAVSAKVFDRFKVVFSQTQQGQVALDDVTVAIARAHRKGRIYNGVEIDLLEILANKCQSSMGAEVVVKSVIQA